MQTVLGIEIDVDYVEKWNTLMSCTERRKRVAAKVGDINCLTGAVSNRFQRRRWLLHSIAIGIVG